MKWIMVLTLAAGSNIQAQTFPSYGAFLHASADEVQRRLNAKPLDLSRQIDRTVRAIMDELDQLSGTKTTVYWADGYGANANPQAGIGLDRRELSSLSTNDSFLDVVRLILGHEQAHMYQFGYYSAGMDDPKRQRAIECQADILGGLAFVGTIFRMKHPPQLPDFKSMSDHLLNLSMKVGSPPWDDDQTRHPTVGQRARATSLGMLSQIQIIDWQIYDRSHDPDVLKRIRDLEGRNADVYRPGEEIMVWSNRIAKQIVGYQE